MPEEKEKEDFKAQRIRSREAEHQKFQIENAETVISSCKAERVKMKAKEEAKNDK